MFDVTRLTVDSCIPIASATSRKVIGFIADTPLSKKPCCRFTISRHDLDDRSRALVERLHQPARACQALAQPGARRLVLRAGPEFLIVAAVDQHARKRRLIELDRIAVARPADEDIWRDALRLPEGESWQPGLGS